jgi:DHA2 family multidrug resistance protein-like MFS transporter
MIAISIGGPFTSILMNHYGLRPVATIGMLMCAVCFFGLAMTDFNAQNIQAWVWMVFMGISVEIALLSSTAAIMSAVSPEKATAAGAIEGMAYELGAGLGIAIFGLLLSIFYAQSIVIPSTLPESLVAGVSSSIGEALSVIQHADPALMQQVKQAASEAFIHSHSKVLSISGVMFLILSVFVWRALPDKKQIVN